MESSNTPSAAHPGGLPDMQALATEPSVGAAFFCNRCQHIHLQLGDLHVRTHLDGFLALVVLLNRAAANFERWAEDRRSAA